MYDYNKIVNFTFAIVPSMSLYFKTGSVKYIFHIFVVQLLSGF